MQFRILGPLTAAFEGEALALGGERQRALLAVLLVHANEMVSTERLIEQLFGDTRAPRSGSAANAVHVAVSRLRRALGDEGSEMLLTRRGGYILELEDGQLDAAVFERLVDEGRALLAQEDAAAASARLREALEQWRGPPLAGLSGWRSCTQRSVAWRSYICWRRWSGSTRNLRSVAPPRWSWSWSG